MKLDILAIGAHPDDVEMSCGATLAKEISRGKSVGIIDLTRGELGTRGSAEIRDSESANAGKILGASARENLDLGDGFFVNNKASQMAVIEMIRKYRPEVVFCNAIRDRHIDHGKGSALVSDACFLSGLRKIETSNNGISQEAWRPKHVLHYIQWQEIEPDVVVDVTGFMDVKMEAIKAYKTQFYDPNSNEPITHTATKNMFESLTYRHRNLGRLIGTEYGEGFTLEGLVAVDSVFDLM